LNALTRPDAYTNKIVGKFDLVHIKPAELVSQVFV